MSTEPNSPEFLISVRNDLEATPLLAALSTFGIEATRTGSFTADFRAEAPGRVNIVVKHSDLARAKEALEEINEGSSDIDWSQVDVGEPE